MECTNSRKRVTDGWFHYQANGNYVHIGVIDVETKACLQLSNFASLDDEQLVLCGLDAVRNSKQLALSNKQAICEESWLQGLGLQPGA
jgi:hypothetical protein